MRSGKGIRGMYLDQHRYTIAAMAIIAVAIGLRVLLAALGWPPLDSDGGTMGLMGMHIALRQERPIFFYGQGYMGAFEAYLAALLFSLFGVSFFTLTLGLILIFMGFLIAIYLLTSLLYSRGLALFTILLLCLGSNAMLTREMVPLGGYPETLLFGAILMAIASWLAMTSQRALSSLSRRERVRRYLIYGIWGVVAGVGIWTHMLVAPFALIGGLLILLFCWRELLGWAGPLVVVTALIGLTPMIIYNLSAPPGKDTLSYIRNVHSAARITLPPDLWLREFAGAFMMSLPTATGANPLCNPANVFVLRFDGCTALHIGWALGFTLLWLFALLLTLWTLRQAWFHWRAGSPNGRKQLAMHVARFAVLLTGTLTFLLYIISPDSALFPVAASRYLTGMLVSLPVLLWPLWHGLAEVKPLREKFSFRLTLGSHAVQPGTLIRYSLLGFIYAVFLIGTWSVFTGIPAAPPVEQKWGRFATQVNDQHLGVPAVQALNQQQYDLINRLHQLNIVHIYSDYWTCNRLIFQSQEHIICSVLTDELKHGMDRYAPYRETVSADHHATFVFPQGSPPDLAIAKRLAHVRLHGRAFLHFTFDGYDIYQPPLS